MRILVLTALLTVASGCYKYVPVTNLDQQVGSRIRVSLSDRGTADLARHLGPAVAELEGQLVQSENGDMTLAVASTQNHSGIENFWNGERVDVPRDFVVRMQERKFSTLRTTLFVGSMLAGGILLNAALGDALGLGIGGGGKNGGGAQQ